MQVPVWIVFDDDYIILDTESIYVFASLDAKGAGGRILADSVDELDDSAKLAVYPRYGVDQVRPLPLALIPVLEDVFKATFATG